MKLLIIPGFILSVVMTSCGNVGSITNYLFEVDSITLKTCFDQIVNETNGKPDSALVYRDCDFLEIFYLFNDDDTLVYGIEIVRAGTKKSNLFITNFGMNNEILRVEHNLTYNERKKCISNFEKYFLPKLIVCTHASPVGYIMHNGWLW